MMDRIRNRARPEAGQPAIARQRHSSRRERELQQRRLLYIGTAVVGVLAVAILLGGAIYQYYLLPRQDLATVNGEAIERRDYWKVRDLQLRQQVAQLSQQYQFVSAEQQPQILQRIEDASLELEDIQGAPVNSDTLASMVDDLLVVQHADEVGVTITDADMETFIDEQFAPVPLTDPTPTQTVEPTAAAWATETASSLAENLTATAAAASPTADASPTGDAAGTPETTGTPDSSGTPEATGTVDATGTTEGAATPEDDTAGTPDADASPEASPTTGVEPTETPNADEARSTSEATFRQFETNYLDEAGMSRDDYKRLIVKPIMARQRISEALTNEIPARTEQVHAAHILVASSDAANEVISRLNNGEDFAEVAREVSTDTGTAGSGGDLGWFPRGIMVHEFEEAAFSLEVDEVSEPVQTEFGWHIIKVLGKEADRPVALPTLQQLQSRAFTNWLAEKRNMADIESDIDMPQLEQDMTSTGTFQAPPEAPVPPTPTPAVTPIPEDGTPVAEETEAPELETTPEAELTPTP